MIQQYFQPKIGRKIRIFNLAGETTFLYKKKRVQRQNMEISSKSIFWVCEQNFIVWPLYKSLNRVNPQSSNGLRFNRQPSQTVIFYRQPSKMYSDINRQLVRYWNLTISADLPWRTSGSRRIFEVEKPRAKFSKIGVSEHFDPGRARAIFFNFKFFFPSNFFNFKIFGDKNFGEKKKVPNFNTGRIIRNLHFPKLQWLTYIKTYKDTWCFQVCNARVGIDGCHWSIILFYSWWQLIIMVTFYWNNYEKNFSGRFL